MRSAIATIGLNSVGAGVKMKTGSSSGAHRQLKKSDMDAVEDYPGSGLGLGLGLGLDLSGGGGGGGEAEGYFSGDLVHRGSSVGSGVGVGVQFRQESQSQIPPGSRTQNQKDRNTCLQSPTSRSPPDISSRPQQHQQRIPFVDVPFPLHPEKTFRIHTSPLAGSPLLVVGQPSTGTAALSSDVALPTSSSSSASSLVSSTSKSKLRLKPFTPSASGSAAPTISKAQGVTSPRLSSVLHNSSKELSRYFRLSSSSPAASPPTTRTTARTRESDNSIKFDYESDEEEPISPNTKRRMCTPINEDMYKSPTSPHHHQDISGVLLPSSTQSPPNSHSPSSVRPLSSRVQWLKASESEEMEAGGGEERDTGREREENYSIICSPSSTPFLHRGRRNSSSSSLSASPTPSPGLSMRGRSPREYGSPVAVSSLHSFQESYTLLNYGVDFGLPCRRSKLCLDHANVGLNVYPRRGIISVRIRG